MNHSPNALDIVSDLRRCIYASYSTNNFESKNFKDFFEKALNNINLIKGNSLKIVKERLEIAKDKNLSMDKRLEDLLMASYLLMQKKL